MRNLLEEVQQNGYIVIDDFLTASEINELLEAGKTLAESAKNEEKKIAFNYDDNISNKEIIEYLLESGNKLNYFFEPEAIGDKSELKVDAAVALDKVGHCLHTEYEVFNKITFSDRVRELIWQIGFKKPVIPISFYSYKNVGSCSNDFPRQESSFICTEPTSTIGFLIALEDSTLQNGCMQFIPGSHKSGVHRRYICRSDQKSNMLVYDKPAPFYAESQFSKIPVNKGSCILLDGQIVYKNGKNRSNSPCPSYIFQVIESDGAEYLKDNWLQPSEGKEFPILYEKEKTE